jgi:hypothetical protein
LWRANQFGELELYTQMAVLKDVRTIRSWWRFSYFFTNSSFIMIGVTAQTKQDALTGSTGIKKPERLGNES